MTENATSKKNHLDRCNTFSFFHIYTQEHVANRKIFVRGGGEDGDEMGMCVVKF